MITCPVGRTLDTTAKLDELRAMEKKSEETFLRFREEDTLLHKLLLHTVPVNSAETLVHEGIAFRGESFEPVSQ